MVEVAIDYIFGQGIHSRFDIREGPTLILLSLCLPKIDGIEILRRIRSDELRKDIPVTCSHHPVQIKIDLKVTAPRRERIFRKTNHIPDGHLKIPHLWPGQNPPPQRWQNGG